MIPAVFTLDFAARCRHLLKDLRDPVANRRAEEFGGPLTTTFAVTMAMALLVVPLERLGLYDRASKLGRNEFPEVYAKLRVELEKPFSATAFRGTSTWSMVCVPGRITGPRDWDDAARAAGGLFSDSLRQAAEAVTSRTIMIGLRCALAHGAVAYLTSDGQYDPGASAEAIAFFAEDRNGATKITRVFSVREGEFLDFLDSWAGFLDKISQGCQDSRIDPPMLAA